MSGGHRRARICALLCSAALLVACGRGSADEGHPRSELAASEATPSDPTTQPSSTQQPSEQPMIGVLVPEVEVVLVAAGFARLERLDLEVGDHVDANGVVAEMDVRGDRSELASATAAWKASQAELERLELELEQAKAKREDVEQLEDFVSKAELREQRFAEKLADARKRSAGASLSQQRSKMQEASDRIAEAELRAPFSGVVASRFVDAGATLSSGDPVVRLISDALQVRFAVPEARSEALRLGAKVRVVISDTLELDGEVVTIAPEIEVGTRLIFAEAKLDTRELPELADAALRVGTVGRVRFVADPRTSTAALDKPEVVGRSYAP